MKQLLASAALLVVAIAPQALAAPLDEAAVKALGQRDTAWFEAGKLDELWATFSPGLKTALKSQAALAAFRQTVKAQLGEEVAVASEAVKLGSPFASYTRTVTFTKPAMPIDVYWSFDEQQRAAGFFIKPHQPATEAPSKYTGYQTQARLQLPFKGTWTVVWGGRTLAQNYHAFTRDQRYAYDILIEREGATHAGDGKQLAQYYCYGQPILAPAEATVIEVVNELPDNAPGAMDPAHPAGNHVILDLGHSEYALLAHMQPGSIKAKKGDRLHPGQAIGLCGNSGNTSEPHLHFHLQDGPTLFDADGLPAQFQGYSVQRGEPVQGDIINQP